MCMCPDVEVVSSKYSVVEHGVTETVSTALVDIDLVEANARSGVVFSIEVLLLLQPQHLMEPFNDPF